MSEKSKPDFGMDTAFPRQPRPYASNPVEEIADKAKEAGGTFGMEQSNHLATVSDISPETGAYLVTVLKALGWVNALWDGKRRRVAVPTCSHYPKHPIAQQAQDDLAKQ